MEGNAQHVVKEVSKFSGKNVNDILEWSSKLHVSLSLCSKSFFEIVQGSQRPSGLDNDQATVRECWDDANHNLFSILYSTISGPVFSIGRRFEGKTRKDGVGHGRDAWAALRKKLDDCSRKTLQAAHREMETVNKRSDKDPDDFLYKKDRCRDRLNSVSPKGGPLGPPVREHHLAIPSTRVQHNPPDPLQIRLVNRNRGRRRRHAGDRAGPQQH